MLIHGNATNIPLADKSVHCCITSPPYWGLRDYGLATWEGGDKKCDHRRRDNSRDPSSTLAVTSNREGYAKDTFSDMCLKCGAVRHDAGIGLEETPDEYIANMVHVFREVWRVLRDDGTAWVNLGDSYASGTGRGYPRDYMDGGAVTAPEMMNNKPRFNMAACGLKPKDLCGIPWRVALALQADGWYLRSDIIWHKPNPMPESVTDRPTKSHEYVFLLSKQARYFYDACAVREQSHPDSAIRYSYSYRRRAEKATGPQSRGGHSQWETSDRIPSCPIGRNRRTVWTIATAPYSGAHFATFPPKLIEPMVKAGTSEHGVCPECGAPWKRVTRKTAVDKEGWGAAKKDHTGPVSGSQSMIRDGHGRAGSTVTTTLGFVSTCDHARKPVPATVLDPFAGSGTTVMVARSLGRHGIGIDLSPKYLQLARQRLELDKVDAWGKGIEDKTAYDSLPLFTK